MEGMHGAQMRERSASFADDKLWTVPLLSKHEVDNQHRFKRSPATGNIILDLKGDPKFIKVRRYSLDAVGGKIKYLSTSTASAWSERKSKVELSPLELVSLLLPALR